MKYHRFNFSNVIQNEVLDDSELCEQNRDIGVVVVSQRRPQEQQLKFCNDMKGELPVPTNLEEAMGGQEEKLKQEQSQDLDQCMSSGNGGEGSPRRCNCPKLIMALVLIFLDMMVLVLMVLALMVLVLVVLVLMVLVLMVLSLMVKKKELACYIIVFLILLNPSETRALSF